MGASKRDDEIRREIMDGCLALKARALGRLITSIYAAELEPGSLTPNQLGILVVVAEFPGISRGDLGTMIHMEKSTVSRNVRRLLEHGLLHRNGPGNHRLRIAPAGRRAILEAYPKWKRGQARAIETLQTEGADTLIELGARLFPLTSPPASNSP